MKTLKNKTNKKKMNQTITEKKKFKKNTKTIIEKSKNKKEVKIVKSKKEDSSTRKIEKLKKMLKDDANINDNQKKKQPKVNNLRNKMMSRLRAARFRYINERLYKIEGTEAAKVFKEDPDAFEAYHEGYQQQVASWPINPVDIVIQQLKKRPKSNVIADLGCGNAKIAQSVQNKVHSFDLIAGNENVVQCDMANVPLQSSSVDVVVFCLSLMGTNLRDYLFEASRLLKIGGIMIIAEIQSRLKSVDLFVKSIEKFGFVITSKDLSHDMFCFLNFKKVRIVKQKNKMPHICLKPCLYKKR